MASVGIDLILLPYFSGWVVTFLTEAILLDRLKYSPAKYLLRILIFISTQYTIFLRGCDNILNVGNKLKIRVYVLAVLSFAMASFLLVHFGMIWVLGRFYIYESSLLVLVAETTLIVSILGFSFYSLVDQLRTARDSHNHASEVSYVRRKN